MLSGQIAAHRRYRLRDGTEAFVYRIDPPADPKRDRGTARYFLYRQGSPAEAASDDLASFAAKAVEDITGPPEPEAA